MHLFDFLFVVAVDSNGNVAAFAPTSGSPCEELSNSIEINAENTTESSTEDRMNIVIEKMNKSYLCDGNVPTRSMLSSLNM